MNHRLRTGWWRKSPPGERTPLKGLSDNPAYQWWRDARMIQPDSCWGMAHDPDALQAQADLMRQLGVDVFRFEVPWRELVPDEPGDSTYDAAIASSATSKAYRWELLDRIVASLERVQIEPLPILVYAPAWAIGVAGSSPAAPPCRPEYVADAMTALVTRYAGRVRFWELWNEPDHPHSWSGSLEDYVSLVLRPGWHAVRASTKNASVVLGGLADPRNLAGVHRAGGARLYDVASFHVYPARPWTRYVRNGVTEMAKALRAVRRERVPIWVTEVGVATAPPSRPPVFGSVAKERRQASFVRSLFRSVEADALFVYQLRDTAVYSSGGEVLKKVYWGLMTSDLRPKPAFTAYSEALSRPRDRDRPRSTPRTPSVHRMLR